MGQCPYFAPLSVPVLRNRKAPITRKPLAPVMMNFKQLPWIPVGADLSRPPPIMNFKQLPWLPEGADLSPPPPLYKPTGHVRFPDEKVNTHSPPCSMCTGPP